MTRGYPTEVGRRLSDGPGRAFICLRCIPHVDARFRHVGGSGHVTVVEDAGGRVVHFQSYLHWENAQGGPPKR